MPKKSIQPPSLAIPKAPFVPGTKKGSLVFTSGQIAFDENGKLVRKGDLRAQTRQVLQNVKAIIEEGGATLAYVMKVTVFISDISDFSVMNEVYAEFFSDLKPARSTIQTPLARPEFLVEIEAVAVIDN